MASIPVSLVLFFLFMVTICNAGYKKHVEKIVIHVPYKIHKHHHIHTKYKIITIPAPKKESTVIYYKHPPILTEHKPQPEVKITLPSHQSSNIIWQQPALQEHIDMHPEPAIQSFLFKPSIPIPEEKPILQVDQNLKPNLSIKPISEVQTILPTHDEITTKFSFKPSVSIPEVNSLPPVHENHIPQFSFKPSQPIPEVRPLHQDLIPNYSISLPPKFNFKPIHETLVYKPIAHYPQSVPLLEDNVAHKSSNIYQVVTPNPKSNLYAVKEFNQESPATPAMKPTFGKMAKSIKMSKKPKVQYLTNNVHPTNLKGKPDYEYEHVGYLIIDGNTQKLVGKDFKHNLHLR